MAVVAERAFTSRSTLQSVEAGAANVNIGIYAAVLQALGLLDGLGEIADISRDRIGQALASAEPPIRSQLVLPCPNRRVRATACQQWSKTLDLSVNGEGCA